MDIIAETKQKFSIAWESHLASREQPSLDFLNDSDQAYSQFGHSIAVINDCLATIKVEVFMVKFLRSHILSDGKYTTDLKLAFNLGEIVTDLETIFQGESHVDVSKNDTDVKNKILEENIVNSTEKNEDSSVDKTSNRDVTENGMKRDLNDKSYETHCQNSIQHKQPGSVSEVETNGESDKTVEKPEVKRKVPSLSRSERLSDSIGCQSPTKGQITIFTPLSDEETENKSGQSKNENTDSQNLSPVKNKPVNLDNSSDEQTSDMVQGDTRRTDERLQSSGNELDNTDATEDPFSSDSCSNSPEPVHESVFLQEGLHGSEEILKIMPFSARSTSFYSVDTSFENTDVGTAEHIYEDIDRYRTVPDEEYETRRHLSQSEVTLKKTFSVGAIRKSKDITDDVFVNKNEPSTAGEIIFNRYTYLTLYNFYSAL